MDPYTEILYLISGGTPSGRPRRQAPLINRAYIASEYELIMQKKSKLSAVKRAAIVDTYRRLNG